MRVGFSTFADHQMGTGHVFRCLRLRDAFVRAWPTAEFVFALMPGADGFALVESRRPGEARAAANAEGPWDVLIVDRLQVSREEMRALKGSARVLASLDDSGPGRWEADVAVNALYAVTAPRPAGAGTRSYEGLEYLCLDPAFESRRFEVREPARRLFLSQGGADTYGLAPKLLDALRPLLAFSSGLLVDVLVGPAFRHHAELDAALAAWGTRARVRSGIRDMAGLLSEMDVAVSGGGLVACELAAAGVPSVLVTGERKELETQSLLAGQGAAVDAGFYDERAATRVLAAAGRLVKSRAERHALSTAAQKAIDGGGLGRVVGLLEAALSGGV